jgi:hypothetical protein
VSITAFRPFVTVGVEDKDTGAAISAFGFEPTPATARKLADGRLLFKSRPSGFQLYAQHDPAAGGARLGGSPGRTTLLFAIRLDDANFLERYHPDLDKTTGPNLYLANRDDDGSARAQGSLTRGDSVEKADGARIVGRRLSARVALEATPEPKRVKVRDRFVPTRTVADVQIEASAGATSATVAIDLSADAAIAYTLAPQPADAPKTLLVADDELARRGAFGALELVSEPFPGPDPAGGRVYKALFRRRS